jgi:hypothetical protein
MTGAKAADARIGSGPLAGRHGPSVVVRAGFTGQKGFLGGAFWSFKGLTAHCRKCNLVDGWRNPS